MRAVGQEWVARRGPAGSRWAHLGQVLLQPLAVFSFLVCGWRWACDLGWLGSFLASGGILSRWQVWFCAGVLFYAAAARLGRYAAPARPLPRDARPKPRPAQLS